MARRSKNMPEALDCTKDCSCSAHSSLMLQVAGLGNVRLFHHCRVLCANYLHIRDSLGRSPLHIAASKGHQKLVQWLVGSGSEVNLPDCESLWTPLHRSVYYGQLGTAVLLVKAGGDVKLRDGNGDTALTTLNADREAFIASPGKREGGVYTWGYNANVTLGHDLSGTTPQKLELNEVEQVVLCKFHTVFLTKSGRVLTCGHGLGGRLGHGSEHSVVVPTVVKAVEGVCVGVAAARNHTVILTKTGGVYTCGLNDAHQLGQSNAPPTSLIPKLIKALKGRQVIAIGTGRYHTAMCTRTQVFTVGKNLGQLGYERTVESQLSPRAVPGVNLDPNDVIVHLSVSDAATACLTTSGRVFVCTGYSVRSIRWIQKSPCEQFSVCASLSDRDHLRKVESAPPIALMLDSFHCVWGWQPTIKGSCPSLIPGLTRLNVAQFSLGKKLTLVTTQGQVFSGPVNFSEGSGALSRLPGIQNARAIFTDFKASNFTFTQYVYSPTNRPSHLPVVGPGSLVSDLCALLDDPDSLSDLTVEGAGVVLQAHHYILASVSEKARDLVSCVKLSLKSESQSVLRAFIHYLYGSHIQLLPPPSQHTQAHTPTPSQLASEENTPNTSLNISVDENDLTELYDQFGQPENTPQGPMKVSTPKKTFPCRRDTEQPTKSLQLINAQVELKALLALAVQFGVESLQKSVKEVLSSGRNLNKPLMLFSPLPTLTRSTPSLHSDLVLVSEDGVAYPSHRCVLVTRCEYFRSMLLRGWWESREGLDNLCLPVASPVLDAVLEFIYTDQCPSVEGSVDEDWVMSVLVMADHLLLGRLKDLCELTLAQALNLRNVCEILELADTYSALQLKNYCLQFVCANAAALLEGRWLEGLDEGLLDSLTTVYQSMAPFLKRRVLALTEPDPSTLPERYFTEDTIQGSEINWEFPAKQCVVGESVTSGEGKSRKKRRRKNSQTEGKRVDSPTNITPPLSPPIDDNKMTNEIVSKLTDEIAPKPLTNEIASKQLTSGTSPKQLSNECADNGWRVSRASNRMGVPKRLANRFRDAENESRAWTQNGRTQNESKAWTQNGKTQNESKAWTQNGRTQNESKAWTQNGKTQNESKAWTQNGKTQNESKAWTQNGRTQNESKAWTQNGKTQNESKAWTQNGRTQNESRAWTQNGKTQNESKAWTQLSGSTGGNLREIMAQEKYLQQQKERETCPKRETAHTPTLTTPTQSVPTQSTPRRASKESSVQESPHSPWSDIGTSPPVSLKELMMEAEAAQRLEQTRALKHSKIRPTMPKLPHQQVSFASIVRSQEMERDQWRKPRKPLRVIQLQEQAVTSLEELYSVKDNPDEYITITAMPPVLNRTH